MCAPLSPPDLGQEDIAFNPKRGEILLEGPHPLPDAGDPTLQLGAFERAQVFGHGKTLRHVRPERSFHFHRLRPLGYRSCSARRLRKPPKSARS